MAERLPFDKTWKQKNRPKINFTHDWSPIPSGHKNSGAELTLTLAGGLDGWANQRSEVVTNAVCALFLMSRAPPVARERLKEGGKVTQFLANLSKRGSEVQKKARDS